MPRPFAVFGTTFFVALLFINFISIEYIWYFTVFSLALSLIFLFLKSVRKSPVFICAIFALLTACLSTLFVYEFSFKPATAFANAEDNIIIGKVSHIGTNSEGKAFCLVKGRFINGKRVNFVLRLSFEKSPEFELNDLISFESKLVPLNSAEKAVRQNYLSKGVFFSAKGDNVEFTVLQNGFEHHPMKLVAEIRKKLVFKILDALPGENGALLTGLLFGDTSLLSKSTIEDFRTIGASHLVAVSGLHFSVFLHTIALLFDKFRFGRRTSAAFMFCFLVFFMAITAFTPSVLRAGFMFGVTLLGRLFRRKPDSLNSLGFAVFLICIINPLKAASIGLQLSFFATAGIILASKFYERRLKAKVLQIKRPALSKLVEFLVQSFLFSFFAGVLTLPSLMLSFGFVSLTSVLSNIFLAGFAGPALIFGASAALFALSESLFFLSKPLFFLAGLCTEYMLWVSEKLSMLSFSLISLKQKYIFVWLFFAFVIFAYALIAYRKRNVYLFKSAVIVVGILFVTGAYSDYAFNKDSVNVKVIENRDNFYVILNHKRKAAVLCCGGNYYTSSKVKNTFKDHRVKQLDLILIPGFQKNESRAVAYLLEDYSTNRLIVSPKNSDNSFIGEFQTYEELQFLKMRLWDKVDIDSNLEDENSYVYFDVSGTKFLITNSSGHRLLSVADVVICKTPPDDLTLLKNGATLIFTSHKPVKEEVFKQLRSTEINVFELAACGDLVIKTSGNSAYKTGRGT